MQGHEFAQRRRERAEQAVRAVADSRTLGSLLSGWGFSSDEALMQRLWEALIASPPRPSPLARALSFGPLDPPPEEADLTEAQHRARLAERWGEVEPSVEVEPLVWALDALGWLGRQVDEVERAAWLAANWEPAPQDGEVADLWARLSQGGFWSDRARWTRLVMGDAISVFRQVLESRQLPSEVMKRAIADLRDVLPYKLAVGGKAAGGLVAVAARLLETGPRGPVMELLSVLSSRGREEAAGCLAQRGHWPETLGQLFPHARPVERELSVRPWLVPERGEVLLDLHVALRLISRWTEQDAGDPGTDWAVVVQNRGRTRARLRALVCEEPLSDWLPALTSWPALAARTRSAVRRWAWEWAWEELALDFSFDAGRPVGVPCRRGEGLRPQPLEGEEVPMLATWVLRVVLRGRLSHLRRWVADGTTGDHDATWGRLLAEIPDVLRDGATASRGGYGRVRAWLSSELEGVLVGYRPLFAALSALPEDRGAMRRFRELTEPVWHAAIPAIASGLPSVRKFAAEALALSAATLLPEGEAS